MEWTRGMDSWNGFVEWMTCKKVGAQPELYCDSSYIASSASNDASAP